MPTRPVLGLAEPPPAADRAALTDFCGDVFDSLARSDQRRCAEAYLRGLIHGTGRRSSRRIAAELAGPQSDQALQQFVNQSPWDPAPVRLRIAELVTGMSAGPAELPACWTLAQVPFVKNGRCSAGVGRQFVPALGRVANVQLAATVVLTAGDLSLPIDWRLCLPPCWDDDAQRRARARVPAAERHRPYWQHLVDLVDELTVDWGLSALPVVADLDRTGDADPFAAALNQRGLGYLVRVAPTQPVRVRRPDGRASTVPATDAALLAARSQRHTVTWRSGRPARVPRSQFFLLPVATASSSAGLLVEWPLGRPQPIAFWLSNLTRSPLDQLVQLAKSGWRAGDGLAALAAGYGLGDYEGRSFLGWHHHVTLVCAAHAFRLQQEQQERHRIAALADRPTVLERIG